MVATEQWFPDYIGGSARVATETSRFLAARGHEVTVLAPRIPGLPTEEHVAGLTLLRTIKRTFLPQTYTDPIAVRRLGRAIDIASYDGVIAHHASDVAALADIPGCPPISYVFHASPLREAHFRRTTKLSGTARLRSLAVEPGLRYLERSAARRAAAILVLSAFSRQLLEEDHPSCAARVRVVGGAVDPLRFHPAADRSALRSRLGVAPECELVVTTRRLVGRMGLETLLHAMAEIAAERPNLRLVVIGDGELRATLEAQASTLRLDQVVRFAGRLADAAVLAWYQAADLFVLPTVAYEGFGIATAEALACGTPVVGTPEGATPEILRPLDPALVAGSTSAPDLADAMRRSLARPEPARRASVARYALERLAWPQTIVNWEEALA